MLKIEKNLFKSAKNLLISGINIVVIVNLCMWGAGCIDSDTKGIAGSYSDGVSNTLDVYDNHTYRCIQVVGYFRDTEVNHTVTGTWTRTDDIVVFTGDCVVTTAYIHGDELIVDGKTYGLLE